MNVLINGQVVTKADEFAYDGCHKVYIIESAKDRRVKMDHGYSYQNKSILPIEELPRIWAETCSLRFISSADLERDYVPQCMEPEPKVSVE